MKWTSKWFWSNFLYIIGFFKVYWTSLLQYWLDLSKVEKAYTTNCYFCLQIYIRSKDTSLTPSVAFWCKHIQSHYSQEKEETQKIQLCYYVLLLSLATEANMLSPLRFACGSLTRIIWSAYYYMRRFYISILYRNFIICLLLNISLASFVSNSTKSSSKLTSLAAWTWQIDSLRCVSILKDVSQIHWHSDRWNLWRWEASLQTHNFGTCSCILFWQLWECFCS